MSRPDLLAPLGRQSHGHQYHSSSSSSGPSPSMAFDQNDQLKAKVFQKVKPICVELMSISSISPTSHSKHASLLNDLRTVLEQTPQTAFTPGLVNYLLTPLTTTLRQSSSPSTLPDPFLESSFAFLALIVQRWHLLQGGIVHGVWEHLWKFCVAAIGPSAGRGFDKGKGRQVGQDTQLAAVSLLTALLGPCGSHPTPSMRRELTVAQGSLIPTLFGTLSLALECAQPRHPHLPLQLAGVKLVRVVLSYLAGQSELLASVLPGIVSAMCNTLVQGGKSLKSDVAKEMAGTVQDVIVETLNDDSLRRLGVLDREVHDLTELADEWERKGQDSHGESQDSPPRHGTNHPTLNPESPNPFPPLTTAYLSFTSAQLLANIPSLLSSLSAHNSHIPRIAAAELAFALASHCRASLPRLTSPSLSTLLLLSTDQFDPVSNDSRYKLHRLLDSPGGDGEELDSTLVDILSSAVNSLPRLIRSQQDTRVDELARLVTAIGNITADTLESLSPEKNHSNVIAAFLGPSGIVERWSWSLLDCLELGRPRGWSATGGASGAAARTAALGWSQGSLLSLPLLEDGNVVVSDDKGHNGDSTDSTNGNNAHPIFPALPLRYVESESTTRNLSAMLVALGAAGGEPALHSVEYFVRFARANRCNDVAKAVAAIWIAERLLSGIANAVSVDPGAGLLGKADHAKSSRKGVRKMAKMVARTVVAMDDEDDEDSDGDGDGDKAGDADPDDTSLIPVERTKGIDALTTLLDRNPLPHTSAASETRALHWRAQRALLSAVSLSCLATSSSILTSSFRPLLLHALYSVLAHLSSPHDVVRVHAEVALWRIAYDTGYASAQNLVLDNVDYVVNVVSQRLTYQRLSPHAPLVLIAMVRLVGAPIVPLVHDVVDEIFDALDDFHGYETLASALLAVLSTLIDAMAADVDIENIKAPSGGDGTTGGQPTSSTSMAGQQRNSGIPPAPNPVADFGRFSAWFNERSERSQRDVDEILERAPRHGWGKNADPVADTADPDADSEPDRPADDEAPPPTRTQEVCTQILSQSIYYLTHRSPFLRARVLALVARAIPVLARGGRESELLPLIDRAWGVILTRLNDDSPYVVVEAAQVIASLAENVGGYISRRIADSAWPRLARLVDTQREADNRSALARRGPSGANVLGTESSHTASHRLYLALLRTATYIASQVPVADSVVWEITLAFRPLLDHRVHPELQRKARGLYRALWTRDEDATWVALHASMDWLQSDIWGYLHDEKASIGANVEAVLAGVA